MKDGLYIGWTKGDLRTGELKEFLEPFMKAVFDLKHGGKDDQAVIDQWIIFNRERMKVLVHCL
jgi:aromatic ring-cleaving dioxygenase